LGAKPDIRPLIKIKPELRMRAVTVWKNKRPAPATIPREMPIHAVRIGATSTPKMSRPCESRKNPSPMIAPATRAKMKSSYEGKARFARCVNNAARSASSVGK
jgi:hypothetical protein